MDILIKETDDYVRQCIRKQNCEILTSNPFPYIFIDFLSQMTDLRTHQTRSHLRHQIIITLLRKNL